MNTTTLLCVFIFISTLLTGCGEADLALESNVSQDAIALCQLYEEGGWKGVDKTLPIDEFTMAVSQRVKSELQSDAVKALVDDIQAIEFYREVYPHVKSKIEALTKRPWDCPALKAFYALTVTKEPADKAASFKKITITSAGNYVFNGKKIAPVSENVEAIRSELVVGNKVASEVLVVMESGTNDQQLSLLFNVFSDLGIENVIVHSGE